MDNGSPWGDTTGTWTVVKLWLMLQNIRVGHSPGLTIRRRMASWNAFTVV